MQHKHFLYQCKTKKIGKQINLKEIPEPYNYFYVYMYIFSTENKVFLVCYSGILVIDQSSPDHPVSQSRARGGILSAMVGRNFFFFV